MMRKASSATAAAGLFLALVFAASRMAAGAPESLTVQGQVSAPAGAAPAQEPVPGAAMEVYYIDALGKKYGETVARTTSDSQGRYVMELPPNVTLPAPGLTVVAGTGDNRMRAFITGATVDVSLFSEHAVHNLLHEGRGLDAITAADTRYFEYMGAREYAALDNVSGAMPISAIMSVLNPVDLKRPKCRGAAELNVEYIGAAVDAGNTAACRFCCLAGADLNAMDLSKADLSGADMSNADLSRAKMFGSNLKGATLNRASLQRTALSRTDLSGAVMRGAFLRDAVINSANLRNADLRGASMFEAELVNANLRRADLRGAGLENADLENCYLTDADLRDAFLNYADLTDADLSGAKLFGADFTGAIWVDGSTCDDGSIGLCY